MNTTAELLEAVDASAEVRAHYVGSSQSELVRGLVASQDYDLAVRVSSVLLGELDRDGRPLTVVLAAGAPCHWSASKWDD